MDGNNGVKLTVEHRTQIPDLGFTPRFIERPSTVDYYRTGKMLKRIKRRNLGQGKDP